MNIGKALKVTGISVKILRYYEEIGLVRPALRAHSSYRVYSEKNIVMLRFVRRARDLGFQVKQIAALLDIWQGGSRASADVKTLALDHVRELKQRRRELNEMIGTLVHFAHHCHGDERPDCSILTGLSSQDETSPNVTKKKATRRSFAAVG